MFPGVKLTQIGLACPRPGRPRLERFTRKLGKLFDFSGARLIATHGGDPAMVIARDYPRFIWKGLLRGAFNLNPPDAFVDWAIQSPPLKAMAKMIYFHRRGLLAADIWREFMNLSGDARGRLP